MSRVFSSTAHIARQLDDAPPTGNTKAAHAAPPAMREWYGDEFLSSIRKEPAGSNRYLVVKGSPSQAVSLVQQAVWSWGFTTLGRDLFPKYGVDGDYGGETRRAVRTYQRFMNLDDDGIVGPVTLRALDATLAGEEQPDSNPRCNPEKYQRLKKEIEDDEAKFDFRSARNRSVFWVRPNMDAATRFAVFQKPRHKTLEMSPGAHRLTKETKPSSGLCPDEIYELWKAASIKFAKNASGLTSVFDTGPNHGDPDRVWYKYERPTILKERKVTAIASRNTLGQEYSRETL